MSIVTCPLFTSSGSHWFLVASHSLLISTPTDVGVHNATELAQTADDKMRRYLSLNPASSRTAMPNRSSISIVRLHNINLLFGIGNPNAEFGRRG